MDAEDRLATGAVRRLHRDPAIEPARPKERLVQHVRPVRAPMRSFSHAEANPSISVRIWLSVCSRSSLPPLKPTPLVRERPMASSSSMKTIEGAFSFASLKRSRTRRRRLHDRLYELGGGNREERNVRLSGDRACEQGLARPRRPEQDPVRDPAAELAVLARVTEKVNDLAQLVLDLLDARDVREGDLGARRLMASGPAAVRTGRRVRTLPARRNSQNNRTTNRIVGPKPKSSVCHHGAPLSSGSALTVTSFS